MEVELAQSQTAEAKEGINYEQSDSRPDLCFG